MSKNSTPTAAAQPLVAFTFNLPADVAARFLEIVADQSDGAPAPTSAGQLAALAVASFMESCAPGTHTVPCDGIQTAAWDANAAGADAEHVNVTLLADDLAFIVEQAEELIHSHTMGTDELTGLALAEHVDGLTVEKLREQEAHAAALCKAENFPHTPSEDLEEELELPRLHAAYLRRLLAASPTMAAAEVCK